MTTKPPTQVEEIIWHRYISVEEIPFDAYERFLVTLKGLIKNFVVKAYKQNGVIYDERSHEDVLELWSILSWSELPKGWREND